MPFPNRMYEVRNVLTRGKKIQRLCLQACCVFPTPVKQGGSVFGTEKPDLG